MGSNPTPSAMRESAMLFPEAFRDSGLRRRRTFVRSRSAPGRRPSRTAVTRHIGKARKSWRGRSSLPEDTSNGYEAVAEAFMRRRLQSPTGLAIVREWAASLPRGGSVLDVGAGSGEPLTAALIEEGFDVSAVDASPTMVASFQRRFPGVEVACEPAEHSRFFDRTFDGVLAIGLVFLLPAERQRELLRRMAAALKPEGRLLFSAPRQVCVWDDLLTGQASSSLGADEYRRIIAGSGLHL